MADFKTAGGVVVDAFAAAVRSGAFPGWAPVGVNHEGFRAAVDEGGGRAGWALLRQSLHDPLLVLNLESETAGGVADAAHALLCWLQQTGLPGVDAAALEAPFADGGAWAGQSRACALPGARAPRLGGGACGELGDECPVA